MTPTPKTQQPRSKRASTSPHPLSVLLLGFLGFVAGVLLLLVGQHRTEVSQAFTQSAGFGVWAATIGAQTAFWVVAAGPLWADLASLFRQTRLGVRMWALGGVLVVILVVFPQISWAAEIPWPLWGHQVKIHILTIAGGLLVGVPAVFGIALVHERVRCREGESIDHRDVRATLEARTQLLRFLSLAGIVIGLPILAAGALHNATVPEFLDEDTFPQEAVLVYGAFLTGLLVLLYVPAHQALKQQGLRIRDHYFSPSRMPSPDSNSLKDWLARREALETLLQLHVTPTQQLQASLFILAPLISAIIGLVPRLG